MYCILTIQLVRPSQIRIQFQVYCMLTTLFDVVLSNTHVIQALLHSYNVTRYVLPRYTFNSRSTALLHCYFIRFFQIHIKSKPYCTLTTLFNMFFPNTHPNQGLLHSYNVTQYVPNTRSIVRFIYTLFPNTHQVQTLLHPYNVV